MFVRTLFRWRLVAVVSAAIIASIAAVSLRPSGASAHPLGNFTVNHSTTIEVASGEITLYRVLDLAEVPAFVELEALPSGPDGEPVLDGWASEQAQALRDAMTLEIEGERVDLAVESLRAETVEGEGGLQTLRLEVTYTGALPDELSAAANITYTDTAFADRIGWREVIVRSGAGVQIANSGLPDVSPSGELRSYPDDSLSNSPDVRDVRFTATPRPGYIPPVAAPERHEVTATAGNPDSGIDGFTSLIARREAGAGFIVLALLTATAFGALHALSPGHGKTIVAAYLVGSRGTLGHAALLGLVVTATHTSSVYLLGFTTLYLSQYILPEDLYPWMGLASGGIVAVMGAALLTSRIRALGLRPRFRFGSARALDAVTGERGSLSLTMPFAWHKHEQAEHDHDHHHDTVAAHSHGLWSHSHDVPGQHGEPVTWRRLVGLGVFGGMIPCPSAIVVMLSAIALHRVAFGLLLIVAFSAGLAAVLTAIGFAVVWGQRAPFVRLIMDRAETSHGVAAVAVRAIPLVTAVLVCGVGALMTARALAQL